MIDNFSGKTMWLSNFFLAPVYAYGLLYPANEHAYHAAKCVYFGQRADFQVLTAADSKKHSKAIEVRSDWHDIKFDVMLRLTRQKFYLHKTLRDRLEKTGDQELIEGNTWGDIYWGVCQGVGQNNLGKILMQVRQEFREKKLGSIMLNNDTHPLAKITDLLT